MATQHNIKKSNIALGKNIERVRIVKNMTRQQLGSKINKTLQQIVKYECEGALVPLPILEKICSALDEPVPKKIIRKICNFRKLEVELKTEMADELIELYNQALPEDILE